MCGAARLCTGSQNLNPQILQRIASMKCRLHEKRRPQTPVFTRFSTVTLGREFADFAINFSTGQDNYDIVGLICTSLHTSNCFLLMIFLNTEHTLVSPVMSDHSGMIVFYIKAFIGSLQGGLCSLSTLYSYLFTPTFVYTIDIRRYSFHFSYTTYNAIEYGYLHLFYKSRNFLSPHPRHAQPGNHSSHSPSSIIGIGPAYSGGIISIWHVFARKILLNPQIIVQTKN